jgi:hypothetical protein
MVTAKKLQDDLLLVSGKGAAKLIEKKNYKKCFTLYQVKNLL